MNTNCKVGSFTLSQLHQFWYGFKISLGESITSNYSRYDWACLQSGGRLTANWIGLALKINLIITNLYIGDEMDSSRIAIKPESNWTCSDTAMK